VRFVVNGRNIFGRRSRNHARSLPDETGGEKAICG
jgi:hypothetical protein